MAELRPMSICVVNPPQGQSSHQHFFVVFLGPIPNAPGFGFFMTFPHENFWSGNIRGAEPRIMPLTDVIEATPEQLNRIKRHVFNVKPQEAPPPLFK